MVIDSPVTVVYAIRVVAPNGDVFEAEHPGFEDRVEAIRQAGVVARLLANHCLPEHRPPLGLPGVVEDMADWLNDQDIPSLDCYIQVAKHDGCGAVTLGNDGDLVYGDVVYQGKVAAFLGGR